MKEDCERWNINAVFFCARCVFLSEKICHRRRSKIRPRHTEQTQNCDEKKKQ